MKKKTKNLILGLGVMAGVFVSWSIGNRIFENSVKQRLSLKNLKENSAEENNSVTHI